VSCANRAGSQKLIDKRRKMKDTKGAEYAMKISKEVWEQQPRVAAIVSKPPMITSRDAILNRPVVPHRTDATGKSSRFHSTRPLQLGPPTMGHVGFSPVDPKNVKNDDGTSSTEKDVDKKGIAPPMTTPTVPVTATAPSTSIPSAPPAESNATNIVAVTDSVNKTGITMEHAETPAGVRRLSFDSTTTGSVKKKQKQCIDDTASVHFFGHELPPLSSSIMATIFQFLPESDIIHTSRVCELWKSFQNQ
jgi:F-box domain